MQGAYSNVATRVTMMAHVCTSSSWICPLSLVPALSLHKKSSSWDGATLLSSYKNQVIVMFFGFSSGVPHAHYAMYTVCTAFLKKTGADYWLAAQKRKTKREWPRAASFDIQLWGKILPGCVASTVCDTASGMTGETTASLMRSLSNPHPSQHRRINYLPLLSLCLFTRSNEYFDNFY